MSNQIQSAMTALALGVVVTAAQEPPRDPYRVLADNLAKAVTGQTARVGVVQFLYEDTDLASSFSALLREEMEKALKDTGRFTVITRQRVAELQIEQQLGKWQDSSGASGEFKLGRTDGLVRGRFFCNAKEVTVHAEIAWRNGGAVDKARVVIPRTAVGADPYPPGVTPVVEESPSPGLTGIATNMATVPDVKQDFKLAIATTDARREFEEGEPIAYRVRSEKDCHVAVFCHQSDGQSILLFPNRYCGNTFVPAGRTVDIPGPVKSGFFIEASPPFGADVVQVIACTSRSEFHRHMEQEVGRLAESENFRGVSRGMIVKEARESMEQGASDASSGPPLWSEARLTVVTYPKKGP